MSSNGIQIFVKKAPWVMTLLMEDFDFSLEDAAAVVGNGGHESDGLQAINEKSPTVKGSRGGFSWFQWTADRRVAFEKYCARTGISPSSDKAAYNWLFLELNGSEAKAVPATKAAEGLRNKVEAFEAAYERAGVKHYDSREAWAQRALTAYHASAEAGRTAPWLREASVPVPTPRPAPETAPAANVPASPEPSAPVPAPVDPAIVSSSPVSKTIGAGKGGSAGVGGGAAITVALVSVLTAYGLLPDGPEGAAVGAAIGVLVTGVSAVISSMIGSYKAKRNAV